MFVFFPAAGRYMYRKGALVPTSLDLYLALEFCDQGDLYHMRGQVRTSGNVQCAAVCWLEPAASSTGWPSSSAGSACCCAVQWLARRSDQLSLPACWRCALLLHTLETPC